MATALYALVTSTLEYCYVLYVGLPFASVWKLLDCHEHYGERKDGIQNEIKY